MYRVLRGLMAKHDIKISGLSSILNTSKTTVSNKLNGHVGFTLSEAKRIQDHFRELGEPCTVEELFFTQVSNKTDR